MSKVYKDYKLLFIGTDNVEDQDEGPARIEDNTNLAGIS